MSSKVKRRPELLSIKHPAAEFGTDVDFRRRVAKLAAMERRAAQELGASEPAS
jgi:hypothetical protein